MVNVVEKLSGPIEELEMKSMQTQDDGACGGQVSASHSSSKSKAPDQRTSMNGLAGSSLQVKKANGQSVDPNGNVSVENDNSSELETIGDLMLLYQSKVFSRSIVKWYNY